MVIDRNYKAVEGISGPSIKAPGWPAWMIKESGALPAFGAS